MGLRRKRVLVNRRRVDFEEIGLLHQRLGAAQVQNALEALPLPFREMARLYRRRRLLRTALVHFARDHGYLRRDL